jgi:DNA-binding CsgD family transcriptional regulator
MRPPLTDDDLFRRVVARMMQGDTLKTIATKTKYPPKMISDGLKSLRERLNLESNNALVVWHARRLRQTNPERSKVLLKAWVKAEGLLTAGERRAVRFIVPLLVQHPEVSTKWLARGEGGREDTMVRRSMMVMLGNLGLRPDDDQPDTRWGLTAIFVYAGLDVSDDEAPSE